MREKVTRRRILGGLTATLAAPAIMHSQGSSGPQSPPPQIQIDVSINLDRDDIYEFLAGPDPSKDFAPLLTDDEVTRYKQIAAKPGPVQNFPDPRAKPKSPLSAGLPTAKRLKYLVRQKRVVIGEINAIDIYANPVSIALKSILMVTDEVAKNQLLSTKIKQAFLSYDATTNPDPFKYAADQMGTDIKSDMFLVRASFTITKNGAPVPIQKQSVYVEDLYAGKVKVTFYDPSMTGFGPYKEENGLELDGPTVEEIGRVPRPAPPDPAHIQEIDQPASSADEDKAVDKSIDKLLDVLHGKCELRSSGADRIRLLAIDGWPEFMATTIDVKIYLPCFWVIFTVPIVRIRFSSHVLFAYVVHDHLDQHTQQLVMGCLVRSALAGVVVGVVVMNFYAGLAAFEALFKECLIYQVSCVLPGLTLVIESSSWS